MIKIKQVLLFSESRLMREMLTRVINRRRGLEVSRQVSEREDLVRALKESSFDWVIMTLADGEEAPDWMEDVNEAYPGIRFMAISIDSAHIKTRWFETIEQDLEDLSVNEILDILEDSTEVQNTG